MSTSNAPDGITTAAKTETLGSFILPDPTKQNVVFDDFNEFNAVDGAVWDLDIGTAGGAGTIALQDGDGGLLLITTPGDDGEQASLKKPKTAFTVESGKQMWFKGRHRLSTVTNINWALGFGITDVLEPTDGLFFQSQSGDIEFLIRSSNVTIFQINDLFEFTDNTFASFGFYFNGIDEIQLYVNDIRIRTFEVDIATLPTPALAPIMHYNNATAGAKTLSLDYVFASKER